MTRMKFLFTLVFTAMIFTSALASNPARRSDAAAEWLQAQTSPQAKPQQKEPVKPPSTGKELATPKVQQKMSAEQANKIIDEALAMTKKPGFDGDQIIGMLTTALPVASPKVTPQSEPAYDVLARLSLKEKYWQTLLQSSAMILKSNPNYRRPALFPRALVGLGDYKLATEVIADFKKKYPKDAELIATEAVMYRQQQKWPETLKLADETLKLAEVDEPSQKNFNLEIGHYLKADALTHLGKLPEASKEYDAIEKINPKAAYLTRYRKRSASIGISKLIVERVIQNPVPLGTYHLYSEKGGVGSLVQLKLYNIEPKDRQLRIEVELPGLTEKATKTVTMLKNTREDVRLVPPLKLGFDLSTMRAERTVQMTIKIIEMDAKGERTIYDDSKSLTILPRDFLPLFRQVSEEGDIRRTPEYIGAWVTSNATAVDKFL
ncbi:MAG: hypothetical protein IAF08_02810, partial [Rhizobacter sp.]|nr:hypothetical protein [Chlorobiales bacterium]